MVIRSTSITLLLTLILILKIIIIIIIPSARKVPRMITSWATSHILAIPRLRLLELLVFWVIIIFLIAMRRLVLLVPVAEGLWRSVRMLLLTIIVARIIVEVSSVLLMRFLVVTRPVVHYLVLLLVVAAAAVVGTVIFHRLEITATAYVLLVVRSTLVLGLLVLRVRPRLIVVLLILICAPVRPVPSVTWHWSLTWRHSILLVLLDTQMRVRTRGSSPIAVLEVLLLTP